MKSISILDKDYINWIKELSMRYRKSQVKNEIHPQLGDDLENILFSIPWGHHKYIIDIS